MDEEKGASFGPVAIFLCDYTGVMAEPWLEAECEAVLVDPQHPAGVTRDGRTVRMGATIEQAGQALGGYLRSGRVVFVAGFPPCTDVSLSGTRWWAAKRAADPYFQAKAARVAEQCRTIGDLSGAPWLFENPASAFSRIFGPPSHKFHPHHFTGWEPADNYRKETWLWTGNGFVMPSPWKDPALGDPDERIHRAPPGPERANFRSATPRGFARAVFDANRHVLAERIAA